MNQNGTELGLTIRMMREKKGMTRPELAEAAGISESHLKKVETGSRRPGIDTYQKIIRILGEDVIAGGGISNIDTRFWVSLPFAITRLCICSS